MSSPTPVVYVFYGEDEPALRERLAAFRATVTDPTTADLNTIRLDGESAQLGDIQSAAGTLPFLADTRLVLIDNLTDSANGRALIDDLPRVLSALPDWARLVFVETALQTDRAGDSPGEQKRKAARRQALRKLVSIVERDPRGKVLAFDVPGNVRQKQRWVAERAAHYGATIEPAAAHLLITRVGDDLTLADAELAKLAAYTNGQRPISSQDVDRLTPYTPEANIFEMVDALGQRNGEVALHLLRQLLDEGDDPLRIFGMIVRQFRLLMLMKEQLDAGETVTMAAQVAHLKSGYVAQKIATQTRHYSLEMLERIYRLLLATDLEMKTGIKTPTLALETLIARLAART